MASDIMSNIAGGFSGSFGVIANIGTVVLWVGIGGIFLAVLLYVLKFKYPLYLIKETAGGGKRFVKDRGFLDKKNNKFRALKNKSVDFPYPLSKHEYIQGKTSAFMCVVRNESASFLDITANPSFIPADYDMREKLANDFKNTWSILKPAEKFWDKYGAQILWIGSMGIFLIVIILILKRMDDIISLGHAAAQTQIAANKQVINSLLLLALFKKKK